MAKNRKLLFLTIALLFQIFFLYQAVFNYHVYTLDPAFRSFAEDFQSDAFSDGYTGALLSRNCFSSAPSSYRLSMRLYRLQRFPGENWLSAQRRLSSCTRALCFCSASSPATAACI